MNYTDLVSHVTAHVNRTNIATHIDTFIEEATSEINRDARCPEGIGTYSFTSSASLNDMPDDVQEILSIKNVSDFSRPLKYISNAEIDQVKYEYHGITGKPIYYTLHSLQIEVVPAPDSNYDFVLEYYKSVSQPSSANPTNIIMTTYPQLFIYGVLKYAYDFLKEPGEFLAKTAVFESEKNKSMKDYRSIRNAGNLHRKRRRYG